MFSLVYISSAIHAQSEAELVVLLDQSRRDNLAAHVTGLLLYKDGNFMQLLEGPEEAVRALMEKIKVDNRHQNVIVLLEEAIERRQFADWSMGFQRLSKKTAVEVPGYTDFLNYPLNSEEFQRQPSRCLDLLYLFRRVLR
jgi:hypothetical protein